MTYNVSTGTLNTTKPVPILLLTDLLLRRHKNFQMAIKNRSFLGVCVDQNRSNLARFLYTFRLYEVTVVVALFVYVVVFIVFLCVVS